MTELKKEYYRIITDIWKIFRDALTIVDTISNAQDARWDAICDKLEAIEKDASESTKDYAHWMIQLHEEELEKRWRWRH